MTTEAYGSRSTRRSPAEMLEIKIAMIATLTDYHPMTVRQVFYQLVSQGVIAKTEAEYKSTVVRLLGNLRRIGAIPFSWIADETRWQRKPHSYSSLEAALISTAQAYRRNLWRDAPVYVEVWLEKEALAGVLYEETAQWDVPLMVCRGYASLSYLHGAAETIANLGKPAYLYYFGDYDPSGLDISRNVEAGIREFAPQAEVHFERVAVTASQITTLHLPTRPTKKTDSRSKSFAGESVEVDAIPPEQLRQLVGQCVEQHLITDSLDRMKLVEQAERATLWNIIDQLEERTA